MSRKNTQILSLEVTYVFTPSHSVMPFYTHQDYTDGPFETENTVGKKTKCSLPAFSPFPTRVFTLMST